MDKLKVAKTKLLQLVNLFVQLGKNYNKNTVAYFFRQSINIYFK